MLLTGINCDEYCIGKADGCQQACLDLNNNVLRNCRNKTTKTCHVANYKSCNDNCGSGYKFTSYGDGFKICAKCV
jgi:hypothetical protein